MLCENTGRLDEEASKWSAIFCKLHSSHLLNEESLGKLGSAKTGMDVGTNPKEGLANSSSMEQLSVVLCE